MGILDFVLPAENQESSTFGMAIQSARGIELEIYRRGKDREQLFRERRVELTLNELGCTGRTIALNCGAIPEEWLGSALLVFEGGAFTGAQKSGLYSKFELAHGGTLLLDEISEMPMESQGYLLRVIEEKALIRLGENDRFLLMSLHRHLHQESGRGGQRGSLQG